MPAQRPSNRTSTLPHTPEPFTYNEAQLRAILETCVEGIITIDHRGIIESFNPSAERIFGYSAGEVIGKNVSLLMPSPDRERHDAHLAKYLATGEQRIIGIGREVLGRRKDGTLFPMHLSVSEVRYGARRIFTGFVLDLTDYRAAEEQATRLGRIVEESINEVYLFDAETLQFMMVNRGARENLGYTMDELQDLTPVDLAPEVTREAFLQLIRPLKDGQRDHVRLETIHRRKDGSAYPVELHLQLVQSDGRPVFIAIVVDKTQRVEYEARLRQERDFAESLIETAHAVVLVLDRRGRIVRYNRFLEEISGHRLRDTAGRDWFETFLPERDCERVRRAFARSLRGEKAKGFVNPIVTETGEEREISWWDTQLRDDDGNVIGVLAIGHDVTDLREAQKQLIQAERLAALGEAMAGLAHESRNALQRIQVTAELLLDVVEGDPEAANYIDVISRAQHDLQKLLQEVREYAAPIQLAYEHVSINGVVHNAWNELAAERRGRNVDFVEEIECLDLHIEADPFALAQVFRNILENSLAACHGPVKICVNYSLDRRDDQEVFTVRIRDNGPGLSAEEHDRAFDSFYTTKAKGTGLGLAIAKRIVEAHGGTIATNPDYRHGSEFAVTLPKKRM